MEQREQKHITDTGIMNNKAAVETGSLRCWYRSHTVYNSTTSFVYHRKSTTNILLYVRR